MTAVAGFRQVAPEVYYASTAFAAAGPEAVGLIKKIAGSTPRRRCRICFHPDPAAPAQAMLIAMHASSYVRPHRHFTKSETLTALEGTATTLLFDTAGAVTERVPMAPFGTDRAFFYRMPEMIFHTLIFETDWFVYLETTTGPFDPTDSEGAAWAPPESNPDAGHSYLNGLK